MKAFHICDNTEFERVAAECRRLGCGIEVQSFYDPAYRETHPQAIEQHRKAIADIPLRSLHGPFGDLCAGSFDSEVRQLTRKRFEQGIASARELGINRIILHHGYIPGTSLPAGWLKRITQFWKELLVELPDEIRIQLENTHEHDPELLGQVIDSIDDPRLSVCLDIGHAHCHGRVPVPDWPKQLGPRIGYVHLHDNHGEADEHLAFGDGTMDFPAVMAALEEHCPEAIWALEASHDDQILRSINWLREHGFDHVLPSSHG